MVETFLNARLIFVTGKGGVGKSTVSAALALAAARRGKRVLLCGYAAKDGIASLFDKPPLTHEASSLAPNISGLHLNSEQALHQYGRLVLRIPFVSEALFNNRLVRYFLKAIPALAELVILGKILFEAGGDRAKGVTPYDLVVVDAPSSGHAVQLLSGPAGVLRSISTGPIFEDATWMQAFLADSRRTSFCLVTLPQDLPINETVELNTALNRDFESTPRFLVINAMPGSPIEPEDQPFIETLVSAPPPLGNAGRAARWALLRYRLAVAQATRLRQALRSPTVQLPQLSTGLTWGMVEIDQLSTALEEATRWA